MNAREKNMASGTMNGGLNQATSPRHFARQSERYVIAARTSLPKNRISPLPKYFRAKSSNNSQKMKKKTPFRQSLSVVTTIMTSAMLMPPIISTVSDPVTIQFDSPQTIPSRPPRSSSP